MPADNVTIFRVDHLGRGLHASHYRPSADLGRVLYISHGLGEHSGRYEHVAQYFADAGYDVVTWDHQGHGRSSGKRGTIVDWREFVGEMNSIRAAAEATFAAGKATYMWGHSLGGLSLLYYLAHNAAAQSLTAAVVTSPWLELAFEPTPFIVTASAVMSSLAPNLTKSNELQPEWLSRDPGVVSLYRVDPLNHDRISMRLGASALHQSAKLLAAPIDVAVPLLLMHGDADRICHVRGSQRLIARATRDSDITFRVWPGLYHELHNEPEKAQVLAYAREWLETATKNPAQAPPP